MSLTAADVAEILKLLEESSFDELTLEMDGMKISLRRGGAAEQGKSAAAPERPVAAASAAPSKAPSAAPVVAATADPNAHDVVSPLLGTFYRAPKPGAPPFVEVGSEVEEDTVVAIIEVMKLMNTVRAGVRGRVTEILVGDGVLVEYNQPLLRVHKRGA